jgi:hypothetical protein
LKKKGAIVNKSGFSGLKIAVIFMLFTGFMFVLVEERLESKEYDIQIRDIQKNIEELNSQKMELSIRIDSQLQRLSSYDYSSLGKPITMKDVIVIPLEEKQIISEISEEKRPACLFDKLLLGLLHLF